MLRSWLERRCRKPSCKESCPGRLRKRRPAACLGLQIFWQCRKRQTVLECGWSIKSWGEADAAGGIYRPGNIDFKRVAEVLGSLRGIYSETESKAMEFAGSPVEKLRVSATVSSRITEIPPAQMAKNS